MWPRSARPSADGMQFARRAVMDLEKIRDDDEERDLGHSPLSSVGSRPRTTTTTSPWPPTPRGWRFRPDATIIDAFEEMADAAAEMVPALVREGRNDILFLRMVVALKKLKKVREVLGDDKPEVAEEPALHHGRRVLESDEHGPLVVARATRQ